MDPITTTKLAARVIGRLMLLTALAIPIAWAAGALDWWFAGITCAEEPMLSPRECGFGEKSWFTITFAGSLLLIGTILCGLGAKRNGAAATLDLSALRRSAH